MGKKVRIRCPTCGMLVWQKSLSQDHKFEFVIQDSHGEGYCKIVHRYFPARVADSPGARMFETLLGVKLIYKGVELLKEAGVVDVDVEEDEKRGIMVVRVESGKAEEVAREVEEEIEEIAIPEEEEEEIEEIQEMVLSAEAEEVVEVPILTEDDVRPSLVKRLKRRKKRIKDIEEIEKEYELEEVLEAELEAEFEI